jgi:hypothetical protein
MNPDESRQSGGPGVQAFLARWSQKLYSLKRTVRVSGGRLIIHCPPDEVATHQPHLQEVIAETNGSYRDSVAQQAAAQEVTDQARTAEQQQLRDIASKLKFE